MSQLSLFLMAPPQPAASSEPTPDSIRKRLARYQVQVKSGAANAEDRRKIAVVVRDLVRRLPAADAAKWLKVFGLQDNETTGD